MTDTRAAILELLESVGVATLATAGAAGPWAAPVFYASDEALRLYFVSDARTRHGRDILARPEVAAAVYSDCTGWVDIRGLQLVGKVEALAGAEREAGLARYLARFPEIAALSGYPDGSDEAEIARRLQAATLYRLTPRRIRLIDNSRGFGFRDELVLGDGVR